MKSLLSTTFILCLNLLLTAQTNNFSSPEKEQFLNEIIIQEDRIQIPFSQQNRNITIIDRAIIKSLPVSSVNELLTYVAGLDVRQRGPGGTQADISIDGGTFDQTLVLINGMKISDPQTGHNMMNIPVSLLSIERIEILRGAAARIYGINAINGAINIITYQAEKSEISIHSFAGSSFQNDSISQKLYGGYGIEAGASIVQKNMNHLISLSHGQSSGYRYNTAFINEKALYQNSINLGKGKMINFLGGFVYNSFGANGFYSAPGDKEAEETVQTGIANLSAILPINKYWILKPKISYRYNHDDYIFIRQKPEVYHNQHTTSVQDIEINNTFFSNVGDFGLGLAFRNEGIQSNNLGNKSRTNFGLFGEYSYNKTPKLLINLGAYANYNSDFGWQVFPGLDIGYDIMDKFRLFVNAGTGQRLPTFTDLYYVGPSNIGNDQLKPEHAFHSELGMKYNGNRLNLTLSGFYRNTTNFIDWVKDSIQQPWQPQNYQQILTKGISFSADYRLLKQISKADFYWLVGLSYTWLEMNLAHSKEFGELSQYALENLRNQAIVRSSFSLKEKFHISIAGRYQQRIHNKEYLLLDCRLGLTINQFEFFSSLTNLTNIVYTEVAAVPMLGRWINVGFKWKYNQF